MHLIWTMHEMTTLKTVKNSVSAFIDKLNNLKLIDVSLF